ncbi:hypothetical protein CRUP_015883, partial [Coryphaenoides rupestris]
AHPPGQQCRSVIHGLLGGKPVSWEVTVDLGPLWAPEEPGGSPGSGGEEGEEGGGDGGGGGREGSYEDPWEEMLHQLTARSTLFLSKANIPSPARRYRVKAIQTSKRCNINLHVHHLRCHDNSNSKRPQVCRRAGLEHG